MRRRLLITIMIAVLSLGMTFSFSYATNYTQNDLSNAKQKTESAKDSLAQAKAAESELADDIAVIEQRIKNTKTEIKALDKKIAKAQAKMDKLTEKFMELQNDLALQESDLNARLKNMYMTSDMSYIDVLLNSENIVDLISNMDMIQRIHKQDVKTVEDITNKQNAVEKKKAEITETHDSLVSDRTEQKDKKKGLLTDQEELIDQKIAAGQDTAEAEADYASALADQTSIADELAKPVYTPPKTTHQAPANTGSGGGDNGGGGSDNSGDNSNGGGDSDNSGGGGSEEGSNDTPSQKTPDLGNGIVADAKALLGVPYRWGGTSPRTGFDCSGFTQYVYAQNGIFIPRTSSSQANGGKHISISNLEPGDIVWRPGHVGLYVGGGRVIHSPQPGDVVSYTSASGFSFGVRY